MKKEQLFDILCEIDEKKILSAGKTMSEKSKTKLIWLKYGTLVACLCLIVISAFSCHLYAKQYVVDNSILVHNTASVIDSDCEVTPEQAEQLAIANSIHNNLSVQNFEWYGNCYYDLQKDKIKGLGFPSPFFYVEHSPSVIAVSEQNIIAPPNVSNLLVKQIAI